MIAFEWLFWIGIGAVIYSYLAYPVILLVLAACFQLKRDLAYVLTKEDRRQLTVGRLPEVALVISAFNEAKHLSARIQNLLEIDYPSELLKCYIGSDGSSDSTGEILHSCTDPRIKGFVFIENRGKASVLNDLVSKTQASIIVFSDANTFFDPQSLKFMVRHFDDPRVGGVSGELRLLASRGDNQDSLYWKLEQVLKYFESRIHGLLGANGAIYSIRRSLWVPLKADTICDDFCVGMNVSASGSRLVYEPEAWAQEETPNLIEEEFHRRVRIGIGNFQAFFRHPEYLTKTSWGTSFAYTSHKVLRWFAPHMLILAYLSSFILTFCSSDWGYCFIAQTLIYASVIWLYVSHLKGMRLPGILKIPVFLFALNWAFLLASWRHALGQGKGAWRRSSR